MQVISVRCRVCGSLLAKFDNGSFVVFRSGLGVLIRSPCCCCVALVCYRCHSITPLPRQP
jgi:hypothetical protein